MRARQSGGQREAASRFVIQVSRRHRPSQLTPRPCHRCTIPSRFADLIPEGDRGGRCAGGCRHEAHPSRAGGSCSEAGESAAGRGPELVWDGVAICKCERRARSGAGVANREEERAGRSVNWHQAVVVAGRREDQGRAPRRSCHRCTNGRRSRGHRRVAAYRSHRLIRSVEAKQLSAARTPVETAQKLGKIRGGSPSSRSGGVLSARSASRAFGRLGATRRSRRRHRACRACRARRSSR